MTSTESSLPVEEAPPSWTAYDRCGYLNYRPRLERETLVVHRGERDRSMQRRQQKLESSSPGPSPEVPRQRAECAGIGAWTIGYHGAGTFESLVSSTDITFIEVNSRVQVEHPVTETLTGIDIVRQQLRIAAGEPLGLTQDEIAPRGARIECRINAEDLAREFPPRARTLEEYTTPSGPFVRVDTDAGPGVRVQPNYDSLLATVITWGTDRDEAIARMRRALSELRASGPGLHTTAGLLADVIRHPSFLAGRTRHHNAGKHPRRIEKQNMKVSGR